MYQLIELKEKLEECLVILKDEKEEFKKTVMVINYYIFFLEELIEYTNYKKIPKSYVSELNVILNIIDTINAGKNKKNHDKEEEDDDF